MAHSHSTPPSDDLESEPSLTYKDAGVDIDAGEALVKAIKPLAASTRRSGTDAALGGFGALFDLKATGYQDPILVSATDGVGTKLQLAFDSNIHTTVGIDLVAMCVNDLVVQGAEPLFFLDYMATSKLNVARMTGVVEGIAEGCRQAGAALSGGETAEMPGMYSGEDYDLAGFTVGVAERGRLLPQNNMQAGDSILGLASSGPHSNGYSLIRRIIRGMDLSAPAPFDTSRTLAEALLTPTRIYVKSCLSAAKTGKVKAFAHITGGGFLENIPRILPDGLAATLDADSWELPAVFNWFLDAAPMTRRELSRTFNCGIGMAVICAPSEAQALTALLTEAGETVYQIGTLTQTDAYRVTIHGSAASWPGARTRGNSERWTIRDTQETL